mgnify:CR=1 FL=1
MTIGLWIGEAKTLRLTTHESTNDYEKTLILDIEKTAHNKLIQVGLPHGWHIQRNMHVPVN